MSAPHPDAVIIHGTTSNGKVFRPSDWAERLCGILSSFNKDHRLSYHEWVHPVLLDKIRCVVIDAKLQEINPSMFRFLMDFAADNDLRVLDGKTLQAEQQGGAAPLQQAVPDSKTAYASGQLREIAADNTAAAYAALSVLRPMIGSVEQFAARPEIAVSPAAKKHNIHLWPANDMFRYGLDTPEVLRRLNKLGK